MKSHRGFYVFFYNNYFLKSLGNIAYVNRAINFDLKLPDGIEKRISPVKILELACGYVNGKCPSSRFFGALKLLEKPVKERKIEDLNSLGLKLVKPIDNLGDFIVIGLMNGLILPGDIAGRDTRSIIPELVREIHPKQESGILPEDWARVGRASPKLSNSVNSLHKIMWTDYSDSIHYLFAIVLARLRNRPVEPLMSYGSMAEADKAVRYWFGIEAPPGGDHNTKKWGKCTLF
ncbi:hypothetical protein [Caballeronia mineralivorans]|nr:hypothetical protein [Caballeronia mineralivorans]